MSVAEPATPLLQVRDLKKHFPITKGFLNRVVGAVKAVDGVSFDVLEGECLGLVGESGSGKTTVGRCILRALDPTEGVIRFRVDDTVTDVATADYKQLKELRQHMQLIFQDPYASLNPRMTVFDIVGEPLLVNGMKDRTQRELRVRELLAQVGLNPQHLQRYPHAFSGGQRQRIGIARGLALNPRLIVADEPVPADLKQDDRLWSGCISGAMEESDFANAFVDAGFYGVEIAKRDAEPWQTVAGIEFRSVTLVAYSCSHDQISLRVSGRVKDGFFRPLSPLKFPNTPVPPPLDPP